MNHILVYNNNTGIVEVMKPLFAGEECQVYEAESMEQVRAFIREGLVQLLIMDIELADTDGMRALENIRMASSIPVIVLSENSEEEKKIAALETGADDYVIYPCNPLELLARAKSQIRRYTQLTNQAAIKEDFYRVKDLIVDDKYRKVSVEGKEVKLTPLEYKILRLLIQQSGKVLSIEQIYESIWNMKAVGADNTIAVHIRHIREKIERNPKDPQYIKVVWGLGYKVG
ncbi:MAG: response regulator transcription factor [Lachnospiraceae bacterium]|nr:response regulator transcription factor [Lachnospiraceae bacterium]